MRTVILFGFMILQESISAYTGYELNGTAILTLICLFAIGTTMDVIEFFNNLTKE